MAKRVRCEGKKIVSAEKRRQSDFNKFEAKTERRERGTMLEFIFFSFMSPVYRINTEENRDTNTRDIAELK